MTRSSRLLPPRRALPGSAHAALVQHLAHLAREAGGVQRLSDQRRQVMSHAVANDVVVRIPRHEQHPRFGACHDHPLGQLAPAHLGHHDVGEQQVDGPGVALADQQRLAAMRGRQHLEAGAPKEAGCQLAHRSLVFDQEDGLGAGRGPLAGRMFDHGLALGEARQVHVEGRAPARLAGHQNVSPALAHDAVHGREPEPRAFAFDLGGEERLEQTGQGGGAHAFAGVAHREPNVRADGQLGMQRGGRGVDLDGGGGDGAATVEDVAVVERLLMTFE